MNKENVIYSAIKKKETLPFVTTWKNPEDIMLSEKTIYRQILCDLTYV